MIDKNLKWYEDSYELQILTNSLRMMTKAYKMRNMNFQIVGDFLLSGTNMSGSTSCISKCVELGIRPHGYNLKKIK